MLAWLVVVGAGVALALFAHRDPGYLVVAWDGWQLEVRSLVAAGLVVLAAFYLLHLVVLALRGVRAVPARLRGWRARRSERALEQGADLLLRGEYQRAERTLLRTDPALLHYLAAAWAAHRRGAPARREELLAAARRKPHAEPAASLLEAHCLLEAGLPHAAEAVLDGQRSRIARAPAGLRLLADARAGAGSHWALVTLLPRLQRAGVIDAVRARQMSVAAHAALLASVPDAREHWPKVPRALRDDPELIGAYVEAMSRSGQREAVLGVLEDALSRRLSPELVELYGRTEGGDEAARLERAERWLAARPRDAVLLHALGRLARRAGQWSRARSFLETAVGLAEQPAARQELGELLLELGERDAALTSFRTGLRTALDGAPPA